MNNLLIGNHINHIRYKVGSIRFSEPYRIEMILNPEFYFCLDHNYPESVYSKFCSTEDSFEFHISKYHFDGFKEDRYFSGIPSNFNNSFTYDFGKISEVEYVNVKSSSRINFCILIHFVNGFFMKIERYESDDYIDLVYCNDKDVEEYKNNFLLNNNSVTAEWSKDNFVIPQEGFY